MTKVTSLCAYNYMKQIVGCFLIMLIMIFGACQTEEVIEENTTKPLEAETSLFFYEGTKDADAIAVDEEGYLYTATRITEMDKITEEYEPVLQQFKVYDLEGTCIKEVDIAVGSGDILFLTAEGGNLYCIVIKSFATTYMPTLFTIDTKTWEVTELYGFNDYGHIFNFVHVGDYFYVIGMLKESPEKEYELHPDIDSYTYSGECISRIKVGEEQSKEEILPVDFPIDIVGTKKDTLLVYHYNEEKGFGFLEFDPQEVTLKEVGWTESRQPVSGFTRCENGFLFKKSKGGIFYGISDGTEAGISSKTDFIKGVPTYQRGFLFYAIGEGVERVGIMELIKDNTPICLLTHQYTPYEPYDNGYQVDKKVFDLENFALKVLAQDTDFDMYLLESREWISYNIKEKGAFYALNEVEGVQEYLDACFPYIKETAINEEGDIWMIPVGFAMPMLIYHKEYCDEQEVDWSMLSFEEFLTLTEQIKTEAPEEGNISTYLIIEEFFKQYLSSYDSFDTDLFRKYAKHVRLLQENVGRFYGDISNVLSVKPELVVGENSFYTQEELEQIPNFFYEYNLQSSKIFHYAKRLGNSDMIGATRIPMLSENIKNVGVLTFLAVNPQSENLEFVLAYISDFCKYMMTQKDSFLLADESTYTDTPFMKECYQVYTEGDIYFAMDTDIYWNTFWDYVEGEMELEEMVEEIERKRRIYVGE